MFEAEYKSQLIRITSLEQELINVRTDKKSLENEFESFKRNKAEEIRVILIVLNIDLNIDFLIFCVKNITDDKKELEKSLRLCKTNENFLKSENERLCKVAEEAEATRLPEKEKEITQLKQKIATVIVKY